MSKRDTYREAFAKAMQIPGADTMQVGKRLASQFGVTLSAIYAATRQMRADMGLLRTRPNNKKKKSSKSAAGRVGGLRTQEQNRAKRAQRAPTDLTSMSVDDAARVLQVLSLQWPALRAAFLELDSVMVTP